MLTPKLQHKGELAPARSPACAGDIRLWERRDQQTFTLNVFFVSVVCPVVTTTTATNLPRQPLHLAVGLPRPQVSVSVGLPCSAVCPLPDHCPREAVRHPQVTMSAGSPSPAVCPPSEYHLWRTAECPQVSPVITPLLAVWPSYSKLRSSSSIANGVHISERAHAHCVSTIHPLEDNPGACRCQRTVAHTHMKKRPGCPDMGRNTAAHLPHTHT